MTAGELDPLPLADIEIAVPVHNEKADVATNVLRLRRYVDSNIPLSTLITVVDNASTDGTWEIARRLEATHSNLRAVRLGRKGRGGALRHVWGASAARVVAYMDVDLSTDLGALLPLLRPVLMGDADIAIGSRLAPGAQVRRGVKRELISRCYNRLLKVSLGAHFSDAQCGFKAISTEVLPTLLSLVKDDEWFFDTELLVLAERLHLRICEIPVRWVDDTDSRVKVLATALADIKGIRRLRRECSLVPPLPLSAQADEVVPWSKAVLRLPTISDEDAVLTARSGTSGPEG